MIIRQKRINLTSFELTMDSQVHTIILRFEYTFLTIDPFVLQKIVTLGQETINTTVFTQVDASQMFLMVEQLTRLVLVGEPSKTSSSVGTRSGCVKQLRLAIFTPSLSRTPPHADYSVRVYALEDNMAALEVVFRIT